MYEKQKGTWIFISIREDMGLLEYYESMPEYCAQGSAFTIVVHGFYNLSHIT